MNVLAEHARALSAARRQVPKVCSVCGTEYTGYARRSPLDGAERAYCSDKCKAKAHRRRAAVLVGA